MLLPGWSTLAQSQTLSFAMGGTEVKRGLVDMGYSLIALTSQKTLSTSFMDATGTEILDRQVPLANVYKYTLQKKLHQESGLSGGQRVGVQVESHV